ncbi:RING finger protein 145-like [Oreochromis niloticus]|uniref:RING finger protein 145-like n=1 Tax=Oreochromis niloticus TaxID=8128 RepID=UPI000904855C|nr:RING finger protein 145-like [Oreochromis niloticus]
MSLWKHFRAVSLCLFLLIFPAYMAYMICQFFHMDFWLLIIISSSILTSLQVAVCVVCYGVSETVFGEWSVMGSTIILVHSYYNVWLRAQLGWQSFLLRRDAVHKIKSPYS